jgi:hypothetical protein
MRQILAMESVSSDRLISVLGTEITIMKLADIVMMEHLFNVLQTIKSIGVSWA